MNPHLIAFAARAQTDDRLRVADERRFIAQASASRSASRSGRRVVQRSLRAVFG